MNNFKKVSILFLSALAFTLTSCGDDDPVVVNEEEVITTLTVTLTPDGGGSTVTLQSRDLDGDGPNRPVITDGTLLRNTVYTASIVVLNETETPAENKNAEITKEADEHQFFYQVTNNLATFAYSDVDGNDRPLGLTFTVTTGSTEGSGNLTITLIHEPNKTASGVSAGNITNAGGETDIQVVFPITVVSPV